MKRAIFIFFASALLAAVFSCAEEGACDFNGKWKVKSADVQSEKLSPSIVSMTKTELLATEYEFSEDGKILIGSPSNNPPILGTWTFDQAAQSVSWAGKTSQGHDMSETSRVVSCGGSAITLSQRLPADTTKAELAAVTMTLEKVK